MKTHDELREMCRSFRCHGGWPGGIHRYTEHGREVLCPVCGGTEYNLFDLKEHGLSHVPALLDENDALRAALREALGAWTNMLVEAKGSSQHVDIEHDLSRIDELAELLPVIEISPIAKEPPR